MKTSCGRGDTAGVFGGKGLVVSQIRFIAAAIALDVWRQRHGTNSLKRCYQGVASLIELHGDFGAILAQNLRC